MGRMSDIDIILTEASEKGEAAGVRLRSAIDTIDAYYGGTGNYQGLMTELRAAAADAYDAAVDLPIELREALSAPTASAPTLDELIERELDKLTDAITNLAALVAPEEAPDPDFDAAPDTPYRIVVEYSDGRVEQLEKVAEFRLIDTPTNQWLIGLTVADEGQAPVLGRWDHEGNWRKLDARSFERRGW